MSSHFVNLFYILLVAVSNSATSLESTQLPIVFWHGMGDSCCFPFSLGALKKVVEAEIPGIFVKSLMIGGNIVTDFKSGYFIHPNKQIDYVCNIMKNDLRFKNGYNAIGFSQGGQFLRGLTQRCPNPPMNTLISIGGQHQGIFGLPKCGEGISSQSCEYLRKMLSYAAYEPHIQKHFVQATYWHDPIKEEEYANKSTFLADINNMLTVNQDYVKNIRNLKKLVLVYFLNDTMVQPKESGWFGFYKPGQDQEIVPLRKSPIYTEDRLGLKYLDQRGRLVFLQSEGDHLQFTKDWFIEKIIPFLK